MSNISSTISSFEVLTEASKLDNMGVLNEAVMSETILNEYEKIDTLSNPIVYTEAMVPVIMMETGIGDKYLVEHENVIKVMEGYAIKEMRQESIALKKIAEDNGLNFKDMILVVESDESMKRRVEALNNQIKYTKDPTKKQMLKNKLHAITTKIDKLKGSGISILKNTK